MDGSIQETPLRRLCVALCPLKRHGAMRRSSQSGCSLALRSSKINRKSVPAPKKPGTATCCDALSHAFATKEQHLRLGNTPTLRQIKKMR
jgi:hypothetical protein